MTRYAPVEDRVTRRVVEGLEGFEGWLPAAPAPEREPWPDDDPAPVAALPPPPDVPPPVVAELPPIPEVTDEPRCPCGVLLPDRDHPIANAMLIEGRWRRR